MVGALKALAADGIRLVMLTGDNAATAKAVARRLGIDEVEAEALPEQKSAVVARLRAAGLRWRVTVSTMRPRWHRDGRRHGWGFVCPSRRVMRSAEKNGVPVYVYEFMDKNAPQYFPPVFYPYGAAHTLELLYVFQNYHGATGVLKPLNAAMVKYWTNFAKIGDPNGAGLPTWPKWSAANEKTLLLDLQIKGAKDSGIDRKCEFWDSL